MKRKDDDEIKALEKEVEELLREAGVGADATGRVLAEEAVLFVRELNVTGHPLSAAIEHCRKIAVTMVDALMRAHERREALRAYDAYLDAHKDVMDWAVRQQREGKDKGAGRAAAAPKKPVFH